MRLWHQIVDLQTAGLVQQVDNSELRVAGSAGGPAWDTDRRAALFADLERGRPTWPILAWNPSGLPYGRSCLLDGHRRVATVMSVLDGEAGLVRDLTVAEPTYLPVGQTTSDGVYWPVNALVRTMPFLRMQRAVKHSMPAHLVDRAAEVGHRLATAKLPLLTLFGGDPASVVPVCERLLPGRVDPATLDQINAQAE
jgi:hypothetical protein